jgi:hypothetical protein
MWPRFRIDHETGRDKGSRGRVHAAMARTRSMPTETINFAPHRFSELGDRPECNACRNGG